MNMASDDNNDLENITEELSNCTIDDKKEKSVIKIQSLCRGHLLRKNFRSLNDSMTFKIMYKELDRYNKNLIQIKEVNILLSNKKIRNDNFPSHISENIAKFSIFKKYKIMPCWDTPKGDLIINKSNLIKQLEVKGFMSDGPSSFGPSEKWDILYFVDAKDTLNKSFKVYEIKLSNTHNIFRNIKINKTELYGEIADNNQRGKLRGSFNTTFKPQLGNKCKLIFEGHISLLDNTI